ncbi:MAG: AAA family ATPase [candidate division KSB1 bacterium]
MVIAMNPSARLVSISIQGYRPFREFQAAFGALEVFVGANGAGKSSLFEFLKFLRDSVSQEIPAEIIAGAIGQEIFHIPGPQKLGWNAEIEAGLPTTLHYQGELLGPVGRTQVSFERVQSSAPASKNSFLYMDVKAREGFAQEPLPNKVTKQKLALKRPNQLALSMMTNPALMTLYHLREYIQGWKFYSSFNIASDKLRKSVPLEQEPVLHEDAGNLSSLLHYLMTEHRPAFDELQLHLRSVIPGFRGLTVKARGGPGEVIAFWQEEGVDRELSLADLSDGILRLICWMALCLQPNPPSLICIDEPDQGVHPKTLPVLAGLFEKACQRTQIFLATHASYFLMQFDLARIAVMRKENGEARFLKPQDSKILAANLQDFGANEIELMHRSEELELLA